MIHPIAFYILAVVIVGCALLVVNVRNIFHAGLFLIGSFLGVAGIYFALQNFFLGAAQLLIYSGAIAVLILFGIMMTQRFWAAETTAHHAFRRFAMLAAALLFAVLALAVTKLPEQPMEPHPLDLMRGIGQSLMQTYMLPFEIVSVVLLAALIGAIVVARGDR